ncbi:hypothetical protein [Loktanella sp. R86503]|uniref:hypothetical protein n=1 Tax=Loktanella sp. R86503 TaxID=3093847 RepID=UPI0036DDA4C6
MLRTVKLPKNLDTLAAASVLADIQGGKGGGLILDASGTQMIGAICASIIISSIKTWRNDGHYIALQGFEAVSNDLKILGLTELFEKKDETL